MKYWRIILKRSELRHMSYKKSKSGHINLAMYLFIVFLLISSCSTKTENIIIPSDYGTIEAKIVDKDSGKPFDARVYAWGSNDSIYAARKSINYRRQKNWLKPIGNTGFHFTTIDNGFIVDLPEGRAKLLIEKGKEYRPVTKEIAVKAGQTMKIEVELERWIDMAKLGWYSGDMHVHRNLDEMDSIMLAEDLNVASCQMYFNYEEGEEHLETRNKYLERSDSTGTVHIDSTHIYLVTGHELEGNPGALLCHVTKKNNSPLKGNNSENMHNTATYLSLLKQAHELGDYVSIEKPFYREGHIWAVNGADFTQLVNNHHNHQGFHPAFTPLKTELNPDYPEGEMGYTLFICDLYYGFLNCGFNVMPTGGSASGVLASPIGYNRIYAKVAGDFSMKSWLTAVKSGHSFVTNGPMLLTNFNGKQAGETITSKRGTAVVIESTIYSNVPIDKVEVIKNGKIVASDSEVHLSADSAVVKFEISVDESSWLAVRCFEKRNDKNTRLAHTSPFFVQISGKPFKLDQKMIQWFINRTDMLIKEKQGYKDQTDDVKAALKIYQDAKLKFEELKKIGYKFF